MSDTDILLHDPDNRRGWLLIKALEESVPLDQALKLAQAAEEFLTGTVPRVAALDWIHQSKATPQSDLNNEIRLRPMPAMRFRPSLRSTTLCGIYGNVAK